jgi:hypothetical protein
MSTSLIQFLILLHVKLLGRMYQPKSFGENHYLPLIREREKEREKEKGKKGLSLRKVSANSADRAKNRSANN